VIRSSFFTPSGSAGFGAQVAGRIAVAAVLQFASHATAAAYWSYGRLLVLALWRPSYGRRRFSRYDRLTAAAVL